MRSHRHSEASPPLSSDVGRGTQDARGPTGLDSGGGTGWQGFFDRSQSRSGYAIFGRRFSKRSNENSAETHASSRYSHSLKWDTGKMPEIKRLRQFNCIVTLIEGKLHACPMKEGSPSISA